MADPLRGRVYQVGGKGVRLTLICLGRGPGPRNVLLQRPDGSRTVRPFRGLRRVYGAFNREVGSG